MSTAWSPYQLAIFEFVRAGRSDGIVNARAGSGKTTTLLEAARRCGTDDVAFVAFNKHIAEAINEKMGRPIARTIHSLGFESLRRCEQLARAKPRLVEAKYNDLANDEVRRARFAGEIDDDGEADDMHRRLKELMRFVRVTLTPVDDDAIAAMASHYGLDFEAFNVPHIAAMIDAGDAVARSAGAIDYTDMLWLPLRWNLPVRRFSFVLVDECQDLSASQLELVLRARAPGGRILAVGDPHQAIMAFAGARADSFDLMRERLNAREFPLSICYRCPRDIVLHARRIVPAIEHAPSAPAGMIRMVKEDAFDEAVSAGDMVLCRLTAPLIRECLRLIGSGVPARVRGRDIGKSLGAIVKKATKRGLLEGSFPLTIQTWRDVQEASLRQRPNAENAVQSLHDRTDALLAVHEAHSYISTEDFCAFIDEMFTDGRPAVLLSTVHRAKGLEAERVFIIEPDKLPLVWDGQRSWEVQQERNLEYVAITRAMSELIYVGSLPISLMLQGQEAAPTRAPARGALEAVA